MAIPKGHIANFEVLTQAFLNDDVALMECTDKETGEPVYVICAVQRAEDDEIEMIPFARMFKDNPYEEWSPPVDLDALDMGDVHGHA